MSSETPNPSDNQSDSQNNEPLDVESALEGTFDPRDLVRQGYSNQDPEEIGSNPGVAPETVALNEPAEVREGFKFNNRD